MDYTIYLYVFCCMLSAFALSGVNFDKILKANRFWEARILVLLLSFALGYLVANCILALL